MIVYANKKFMNGEGSVKEKKELRRDLQVVYKVGV